MSNVTNDNNEALFQVIAKIKEKIRTSQLTALRAVNKELISLYWEIGQIIFEKQDEYSWGKSTVEALAKELQEEFPGTKGFSSSNLWRTRNFYLAYHKSEKLAQLVREIGWSHNLVILEKCKDDLEKEYYIQMTRKFGWSRNVLSHHIETNSYENYLTNQTSFDRTLPDKYKHQARLAVKDEYTFNFLEINDEHSERELEEGLISNIRNFLNEMGGYFTFVGSQYRLEVDKEEYFIDLLLYHRKLRCLVAIELKSGKFKPEYAGKMAFYLSALDDIVRLEEENPSIGIIICHSKKRTTVEYSLRETNKPMGVASYRIQDNLPRVLKSLLPTPEEIIEHLKVLEVE